MALLQWLDGLSGRLSRQHAQPEPRPNPNQLEQILEEGKFLLRFAVEAGKEVDPQVAARIIEGTDSARQCGRPHKPVS